MKQVDETSDLIEPVARFNGTGTADAILALDQLTLRGHTEQAGDEFDATTHRASIERLLPVSELCAIRRSGELVAYAMLRPESATCWFVTGFNTHPMHRTAPVLRELFSALGALVLRLGITELRSNVYKTNRLSMSFHKRLGFHITRENAKGVEFFASVAELAANPSIGRTSNLPHSITFRHAKLGDAVALFEAQQDAVLGQCQGAYSQAQIERWFEGRTHEIHHAAIRARQILLAEIQGRVVGFVGFIPGEVTLLFVRTRFAGSGLGSRLFAKAIERAAVGHEGPLTVVATKNS